MRTVLFWIHLLAGVFAGLVIAIMCFTGVVLAFEKQIVAFAERDVRRVDAAPGAAPRKSLDEIVAKARTDIQGLPPQPAVTVSADPLDNVVIAAGRGRNIYANPYTGALYEPKTTRTHDFMHFMEDWHRWLALGGEQRALGKGITGACNLAFAVLAVTGLYIWWPKRWDWKALRPSIWFTGASGKARDWNWHNSIGFWCAPILIVLTLSGVVISYRWATDLVYKMTGNPPPQQGGPGAPGQVEVPKPEPGTKPLGYDALLAAAQAQVPKFETINLRFGAPPQRTAPPAGATPPPAAARPEGERGERKPQAVTASIRAPGTWPLFALPTWQLDPFTGAVLKRESFADQNGGRQARMWLRFLHTGEALGIPGQFFAGLACLGGLFLVWTGYALAWRRFRAWRRPAAAEPTKEAVA